MEKKEKIENRYRAGANRPKVTPGGGEPIVTPEEVVTPVVEPETPAAEPMVTANFLATKIEQKRKAKSTGFYLSDEAITKLDKLAKKLKCTRSKALDTLIRETIE